MKLWVLSYFLHLVGRFGAVGKSKGSNGVGWVTGISTVSRLITESKQKLCCV